MTPITYDKYKGHTKGPFEVQEDYNKFFLVRRHIDKKKGFEVLEVGQNEAEKDGCKLNGGMALQLIRSPDFFQTIADQALSRADVRQEKDLLNVTKK